MGFATIGIDQLHKLTMADGPINGLPMVEGETRGADAVLIEPKVGLCRWVQASSTAEQHLLFPAPDRIEHRPVKPRVWVGDGN